MREQLTILNAFVHDVATEAKLLGIVFAAGTVWRAAIVSRS